MLEHVPHWLGHWLRGVRAGHAGLIAVQPDIASSAERLALSSPAFADGARLPERFTADGDGVSPPLIWDSPPEDTVAFALVVEDADAPAPHPLVHAILWRIDAQERRLAEGALSNATEAAGGTVGRNSYLARGWLPPDPPTGHGSHDYVFQLFALGAVPEIGDVPGRSDMLRALEGQVLAAGILIGTYSRGEAAPLTPEPEVVPA
ncbi:MAG: YbhB/YbcL family Raf kinase inhibitor-like protein [Sphingobium sp.]